VHTALFANMKSLITTAALLLCSDATQDETSLMQGLMPRSSKPDAKAARKDATAKLMETATKMMKNGATPDVVTFIETTITEVNSNVLSAIVDEHHRDQSLINQLLDRFDAAVTAMEACVASVEAGHTEGDDLSGVHQLCRSQESIACARSRKCEEELEELWTIVKFEEEEMRRIHWAIHGEWCVGPAPPHPGTDDPFRWTISAASEGDETSQTLDPYPVVDLTPAVIEFRRFSVEYFGLYIAQKPKVEKAWRDYNSKLLECAALEETWTLKVDECDDKQDDAHQHACSHAANNRQCTSNFGHEYHLTMVAYTNAVTTIRQLEFDRKREWETLHIVTCLLETVYTHVIHSIDSGEPCPTTESHPEQTVAEINTCHIVEESMTTNLTIDYGTPPDPPSLPPPPSSPCTAQYVWEETTFNFELQASHSQSITDEGLESYFTVLSAFGWAGCAAPKACTPCQSTDLVVDPTYEENDVCKHHHGHLRPGQMDWDTFKCLSGEQCINSDGRCNDVQNCDDGSDELGCDTPWGIPAVLQSEECKDPFVADLQFQCSDGSCTHIAGRCNGVNNCGDGSDEQGCATTTTGLTLEAFTGYTATIETPAINTAVFYDRSYTFDSLGSFMGHSFIKMSNEDKHIRNSHVQMKLRLPQPMIVYVAKLDDTPLPWLAAEGWALTALEGVTYHGSRETRHTEWSGVLTEDHYGPGQVYAKTFPAGAIEMRGNNGGDGSYVMFVANPANPPQPPAPALWSQHLHDRMKCNNNVDMQYVADQAACQALAVASGHHFYSFRHNGESQGHKCMSSGTCDSPLDERTNEWNMYTNAINGPQNGQDPALCPGTDITGEWTVVVASTNAAHPEMDVGSTCFNELFRACPVVRYTNPNNGGTGSGVYVRHGAKYAGDAHDMFTHFWVEAGNQFQTDFEIYSSIEDARTGTSAWPYCNFADQPNPDHVGVGFPRDCGPAGYQPYIWYPHGGQAYFEAYTGANCPTPDLCPGVDTSGDWTAVVGGANTDFASINIEASCFNALFRACPVVKYDNPANGGTGSGVYVRHGAAYGGDAYDLFTHFWVEADNRFHTDFDIYSTEESARAGTGAWPYCNFADQPNPDHVGVGFPRDCGPNGYQPHIWYPHGGTGRFWVYTGDDCPAH
jgi:hypothetical protein